MKVSEVMTNDTQVIRPEESVQAAAKMMLECDIGSLPVCDGERLQGMVTDRDITIRAVAEGMDPATTHISEVMSDRVHYCYDDDNVEEAARLMEDNQIRRLPVLNRQKRLVGILSLGDVAVETGNRELAGQVLERVSEPTEPARLSN